MTLSRVGKVYLVGAGPGDPSLITLRAVECLRRADVVFHDYLVNRRLLNHVSPTAKCISLGSHSGGHRMSQAEVNQSLVAAALAGQTVVRLKGGDPAIFAHLEEELEALEQHGIPYEIVPGVTTALAAGCHAGIPLTQRDDASAVAFVTGHERPDKPNSLNWAELARFPGTLVIYMGVTTVESWSQGLLGGGMAPETPIALIRRCSWPDQKVVHTNLGQVQQALTPRHKLPPPVIAVVGPVASRAHRRNWFSDRPLFGTRILVTRPAHQANELDDQLTELGADVVLQPAITIGPPPSWAPVDEALQHLDRYDWIVFSSANGVESFVDRLWETGRDLRALGRCRLASIGPGTTEHLHQHGLRADCEPPVHRAEGLVEALAPVAHGQSFLLIRASRGREVLADGLTAAGGKVDQVVAYQSDDVLVPDTDVRELLMAKEIDWTTVTSSAIARSLVAMFGEALQHTKLVSISPVTSSTLRDLGYEPTAEASDYTMAGVVAAITRRPFGSVVSDR